MSLWGAIRCLTLVESLANVRPYIRQRVRDKLVEHGQYIVQRGTDMPEVANWNWPY